MIDGLVQHTTLNLVFTPFNCHIAFKFTAFGLVNGLNKLQILFRRVDLFLQKLCVLDSFYVHFFKFNEFGLVLGQLDPHLAHDRDNISFAHDVK